MSACPRIPRLRVLTAQGVDTDPQRLLFTTAESVDAAQITGEWFTVDAAAIQVSEA